MNSMGARWLRQIESTTKSSWFPTPGRASPAGTHAHCRGTYQPPVQRSLDRCSAALRPTRRRAASSPSSVNAPCPASHSTTAARGVPQPQSMPCCLDHVAAGSSAVTTSTAPTVRLPLRRISQRPSRRLPYVATPPGSVNLSLFKYAPPWAIVRRAADTVGAVPAATIRLASGGRPSTGAPAIAVLVREGTLNVAGRNSETAAARVFP